ncbi:hypothetical protein ACHAXT_002412 [Thalassiosira profunda]
MQVESSIILQRNPTKRNILRIYAESSTMAEDRCSDADVVCIPYGDLVSASPNDSKIGGLIERAFGSGPSSLGIVAITDVPELPSLRRRLLPMAQKLATLSEDELKEVTVPEAGYQVGWSHGREKLEGDQPDLSKGSFYANPLTEDLLECMLERRRGKAAGQKLDDSMDELLKWDESLDSIADDDLRAVAQSNPAFFAPNVWPSNNLPDLEAAFTETGRLMHDVGTLVAQRCDAYVSVNCPGYEPKLEKTLRHSKCCKARLLHYFATDGDAYDKGSESFSSWCGWHNDHGSITGLLPAMYIDGGGNVVECPDPTAGLYIKSRTGALVHAKIPNNAVAFQVGETAQIHTGGLLQATPHAVRGCKGGGVSRETFAVFMEPEYHSSMNLPKGRTLEDTQRIEAEKHLPKNVRTLRSRWKLGQNFGEFSDATFAAFH